MHPRHPFIALLPAVLLALALLTGCGAPPGLDDPDDPPPTAPPPANSPPGGPPPGPPGDLPAPSPGSFPTEIALSCDGRPEPDELVDALRSDGMLDADTPAEVVDGPYCSGRWQYAVISVTDRDPLQVVTRGEPGSLELITAGTDVCSVEVRFQAPAGIQSAAAC